jgi:hypothetical protein
MDPRGVAIPPVSTTRRARRSPPGKLLSRIVPRQELEKVASRVAEIDAAPAVPVVDLHVLGAERPATIRKTRPDDAVEDHVERCLAHLEYIVLRRVRLVPGVEVERLEPLPLLCLGPVTLEDLRRRKKDQAIFASPSSKGAT